MSAATTTAAQPAAAGPPRGVALTRRSAGRAGSAVSSTVHSQSPSRVQGAPRLWAVGPVTKGAFWETTAVPDIRRQAEILADRLMAQLPVKRRLELVPRTVAAGSFLKLASRVLHRLYALTENEVLTAPQIADVFTEWNKGDLDSYLVEITADTAGVIALALRHLGEVERDEIAGELSRAFTPFGTSGGYALPGVALCASGS